jgi:hypothetical protein
METNRLSRMFLVLLEVNYYNVRAEMHSNLFDHRWNCYHRFRLSLKRQLGAQILLAAGYLSGYVVKTYDRTERMDVSEVRRMLITTFIKESVFAILSLSDYIHIFIEYCIRSILILFSHLQPCLLSTLLLSDIFCDWRSVFSLYLLHRRPILLFWKCLFT